MELSRVRRDLVGVAALALLAFAVFAALGGAEGVAGTTVASKALFVLQGSLCVAGGFLVGRTGPLLVWKAWRNRGRWAGGGSLSGKE